MSQTDINNTNNIGGGNTNPPPKSMRKCCFTLNNHTNTDKQTLLEICKKRNYKIIVGEEVGEQGTPHLQGYIEFPSPKAWATIKKLLPKAHIERARGNREQNLEYCKKEGNFTSTFPIPLRDQVLIEYDDVEWYDWQNIIIDLYDTVPDRRTIHWVTDVIGNNGKSFLTRFLIVKHNILVANGKKADVFHQVAKRLENVDDPKLFKMVVLDIPRHSQEFTNYAVLEELKNGYLMSGKYEGGTFVFPVPHVVVFSNQLPDYSKFSMDRWNVITL